MSEYVILTFFLGIDPKNYVVIYDDDSLHNILLLPNYRVFPLFSHVKNCKVDSTNLYGLFTLLNPALSLIVQQLRHDYL